MNSNAAVNVRASSFFFFFQAEDGIRDQLSAHFRIKQSHRAIQSSGDVAAYSELIGRRLLGLERGVEASSTARAVGELGRGRGLEGGPDVAVQRERIRRRDGHADGPRM